MKGKRKWVFLASIVLVLVITIYYEFLRSPASSAEQTPGSIFFNPFDVLNRTKAARWGIQGYISITSPDISSADNRPSLQVPTGTSVSVTLLFHFVSYYDNVTEVQLKIDPNDMSSGELSFPYGADKTYVINSILSYEPSGNVTIKAGETLPIKMTITPLKDGPSLPDIPLGMSPPLGITLADVNGPRIAIIDEMSLMIHG